MLPEFGSVRLNVMMEISREVVYAGQGLMILKTLDFAVVLVFIHTSAKVFMAQQWKTSKRQHHQRHYMKRRHARMGET